MKNSQIKGFILLLLTGIIWGSSFVAQTLGMENVEAFTFNGIRTLVGSFVLLPIVLIMNKKQGKSIKKHTLKQALILGVVFCLATNFQQFAFYYTSTGKIAFITGLYMFLVPFISIFLKKPVSLFTWFSVFLGFVGLYFLCITPENLGAINTGDALTMICSVFFAIHILLIDKFTETSEGLHLSFLQFFISGVISCILMFIFETPQLSEIKVATMPILYSGVMSTGVAYTCQILGQKYISATLASLLMSTETVFAVISAALILSETMTPRETLGCVIMFVAIVLSQVSEHISQKLRESKKRLEHIKNGD